MLKFYDGTSESRKHPRLPLYGSYFYYLPFYSIQHSKYSVKQFNGIVLYFSLIGGKRESLRTNNFILYCTVLFNII